MSKFNYLLGMLKHLFNNRISIFALVDSYSEISKSARVCHHAKIFKSQINNNSYIAPRTQIVNSVVGKYCSIASDCSIGLDSHSMKFISTSPIFTSKRNSLKYEWVNKTTYNPVKKVIIGNDVWIGNRVIIIGGVKIGNGAIIGAGAIVTKDVPDYAIVVGVPAQVIKYRFSAEIINKLLSISWWEIAEEDLRSQIDLFSKDNFSIEELSMLSNYTKK